MIYIFCRVDLGSYDKTLTTVGIAKLFGKPSLHAAHDCNLASLRCGILALNKHSLQGGDLLVLAIFLEAASLKPMGGEVTLEDRVSPLQHQDGHER